MITKFTLFVLFLSLYSSLAFAQHPIPTYCKNDVCTEYMPLKDVRLNGNIPLKMTVDEMISKLGQPDSSFLDQGWDCGNYIDRAYEVMVYYYGKTQFISSNGTVLLHILNLEDGRFSFTYKDLKLKKGLDKADLERVFPITYRNYIEHKYKNVRVEMESPANHPEGSGWIFSFKGEKVIEIRLWWFIC